jgi:hypothetical protein
MIKKRINTFKKLNKKITIKNNKINILFLLNIF